jgi:hypothetical protein
MVHVHGAQAQQLAELTRGVDPVELVAVPIDVGKHAAMALVCDFTGELLARPFEFPITMAGVALLVQRVQAATHGRAHCCTSRGQVRAGKLSRCDLAAFTPRRFRPSQGSASRLT